MKIRMSEANQDKIIKKALQIMEERLKYKPRGNFINSPQGFKDLLLLRDFEAEREVFTVFFLDNKHNLIAMEDLFKGSINSAEVHPREIMKRALFHNCAAIALAHQHPSGIAEPSRSDIEVTAKITTAMKYIDIRVLDHLIVGAGYVVSLAERGDM